MDYVITAVNLSFFRVTQRLELRAQKFGAPVSDAAKKEARAIRFGITSTQTSLSVPVSKDCEIFFLNYCIIIKQHQKILTEIV